MQLLYPDDTSETRETRVDFCLDLYLNTPDKNVGIYFLCVITLLFSTYLFLVSLVCYIQIIALLLAYCCVVCSFWF